MLLSQGRLLPGGGLLITRWQQECLLICSVYKKLITRCEMEGRTQASRSIADPSYLPGNGNAGILGGGTYTGNSLDPQISDWEK